MLMLLKPWRDLRDLKDKKMSWEDAFNKFRSEAPQNSNYIEKILAGIQYYHDCEVAAKAARIAECNMDTTDNVLNQDGGFELSNANVEDYDMDDNDLE